MREILFRGKRASDRKWLYGYYSDDKVYETHFPCIFPLVEYEDDEDWAILPETVGQFTGLVDKNGKKIFEGDIVVYNHRYYEIRYIEKYARFVPILPNTVFCVFAYDQGEVIGNIFDNPELIGGVEK